MATGSNSSKPHTNFLILAHMAVFSELSTGWKSEICMAIFSLVLLCDQKMDMAPLCYSVNTPMP